MAEGVQTSRIFVPCLSESYSSSPNCLREIRFAADQNKWMAPVRFDDKVTEELKLMTAGLLYISISSKELNNEVDWKMAMDRLENEICIARVIPRGHQPSVSNIREALSKLKFWLKPVDMMDDYEALRLKHQEGTRAWLLEEVDKWIDDEDNEKRTLWLKGVAGVGKSVMAALVITRLRDKGQLGGCFFCKHDNENHNNPQRLITTLAFDLAKVNMKIRQSLLELYQSTPEIVEKSIPTCFRSLILEPLQQANTDHRIVLVLDALDECVLSQGRKDLFLLIASDCKKLPPFVKLFITSRPENDITTALNQAIQSLSPKELKPSDENNQRDLLMYARKRLSTYLSGLQLEEAAQILTSKAQGLFLWLHLACEKFDESEDSILHTIEKIPIGMEGIYERVFNTGCERLPKGLYFKVMGTIITVEEPLSISTLGKLIEETEGNIRRVVIRLQSILNITGKDDKVQVIHKSVTDFLTNPQQSKPSELRIDIGTANYTLAVKCMKLMLNLLRKNICNLDPCKLNSDISDLKERQEKYIPEQLVYSCKFWVTHLVMSGIHRIGSDESSQRMLVDLFNEKLLFWVEVMSIIGETNAALQAMNHLEKWLHEQRSSSPSIKLASDMQRLLREFKLPISQGALQVYCSALPFCPKKSAVFQQYKFLNSHASVIKGQNDNWTPCLQTLEGHLGWVWAVAMSADGRHIVSGGDDGTVRVWDASSGEGLRILEGHLKRVRTVVVSANGKHIVSGSDDGMVRVWDASSGEGLHVLEGHSDRVLAVAVSADGKFIVSGGDDWTVRVWDASSGEGLRILEGHSDKVRAVVVSADGKHIVSGGSDRMIRVWDSSSGEGLRILEGHSGWVRAVVMSDGKHIVSGGDDRTVRVWDLFSGEGLCILEGHLDWVLAVAVSPDGKHIVSGGSDRTVRVWDASSGEVLCVLEGHLDWVLTVAVSADGKHIVSGGDDQTVRVWDVSSGEGLHVLEGHPGQVLAVVVSADGKHIVSGGDDGMVRMWDASSGERLHVLEGYSYSVRVVAMSVDGKHIVSGGDDGMVRVWDASSRERLYVLEGHLNRVRAVAVSANGKYIVSGGDDGMVRVWDASSGEGLYVLGHSNRVRGWRYRAMGSTLCRGAMTGKSKCGMAPAGRDCVSWRDTSSGSGRWRCRLMGNTLCRGVMTG